MKIAKKNEVLKIQNATIAVQKRTKRIKKVIKKQI
jgi:hypothetical protein